MTVYSYTQYKRELNRIDECHSDDVAFEVEHTYITEALEDYDMENCPYAKIIADEKNYPFIQRKMAYEHIYNNIVNQFKEIRNGRHR